MIETAFYHAALAVALGMVGQVIAARFAMPSIVVLLALGVAAGPDGYGVLDPDAFGTARAALVTLAVSVILFEGGLALRLEEIRQQQRSLTLLLTLGGAISMVVGTCAAHVLLDMPWPIAALYGSLMIVTGPTVVTPLLSRLTVDRTVRELLIGEGVLIDPIGAIVAIVVSEYVVGHYAAWEAGWVILMRLGVGGGIGGAAGAALTLALRRRWIPDDLRNPAVLGAVLLVAAAASRVSSEAGLMAAVVQGVVMGNAGLRELRPLRQFKEEMTTLLLSFLFVVLAADLPLQAVRALGWRSLIVVALLAWVARPVAVLLCTRGSGLSLRQKAFVAWICPRGIVAAAVAGLFSILLRNGGIAGGEALEALVFVTVALTVTVQGLSARTMTRLLGIDVLSLRGTMIVGADALGRLLGRLLQAYGRQVVLMDLNPRHCDAAHADGLLAYHGDALSIDDLEEAGARYADLVIAMTANQELNSLVRQRILDNFRVERVLAVGEASPAAETDAPFPGDFPGIDEVSRDLRRGRLIEYAVAEGDWIDRPLSELPYGEGEFALLVHRRDTVYLATSAQTLAEGDRLICFTSTAEPSPLATALAVVRAVNAQEPWQPSAIQT